MEVISLTGAVMLGLEAIIVIFIYKKFLEKDFSGKRHFGFIPWLFFS